MTEVIEDEAVISAVSQMPTNGEHFRSAEIAEVAFGKREITVIAVPYDQEAQVPDWRPRADRERFARGSFTGIESRTRQITMNREHSRDKTFAVARSFDPKSEEGLVSVFRASETPLGDESLQLAADGALWPSVAFAARSQDMAARDGVMTIYRAFLLHVALTSEPAYVGAEVLSVRSGEPIPDTPTPNLDLAAALLREIQAD